MPKAVRTIEWTGMAVWPYIQYRDWDVWWLLSIPAGKANDCFVPNYYQFIIQQSSYPLSHIVWIIIPS